MEDNVIRVSAQIRVRWCDLVHFLDVLFTTVIQCDYFLTPSSHYFCPTFDVSISRSSWPVSFTMFLKDDWLVQMRALLLKCTLHAALTCLAVKFQIERMLKCSCGCFPAVVTDTRDGSGTRLLPELRRWTVYTMLLYPMSCCYTVNSCTGDFLLLAT